MLNHSDYASAIRPVAKYPHADEHNIAALDYCIKGLNGETGEVCEKLYNRPVAVVSISDLTPQPYRQEIALELGDVLWYIERTAVEIGINLDEVPATVFRMNRGDSPERAGLLLAARAGRVAEIVKKATRDEGLLGHDILTPERMKAVHEALNDMLVIISYIATCYGYGINGIATMNVAKVINRMERGTLGGEGDHR